MPHSSVDKDCFETLYIKPEAILTFEFLSIKNFDFYLSLSKFKFKFKFIYFKDFIF